MNSLHQKLPFAALLCVAAVCANAQLSSTIGLAPSVAVKQQAIQSSFALFAAHNYSGGEQALEAGNTKAVGTTDWNLESAASLIYAANHFRGSGDAATAGAIAKLALAQLGTADTAFASANSAAAQSRERTFAGQIYLKYLGDRASALQLFTQAAALDPTNSQAASALAWLTQMEAVEAQKVAQGSH